MMEIKYSSTNLEGHNQGQRKIHFSDITNQPHYTGKSVVDEKGIELYFSDKTTPDYSLMISSATSTTSSTNSSINNANTSEEPYSTIQKIDTNNISTSDI